MTFMCLAQACRRLGIDAKTLRRWLTHAHLPLLPHPSDGRSKGLSEEQVRRLARLHQRSLSQEPDGQAGPPQLSELPGPLPLPAELLALPQTLCALQRQVDALQQQVSALTHLLEPTPVPLGATESGSSCTPTKPPARVLALVEYASDGHYVVICPKEGRLACEAESAQWFAWLDRQTAFRFVGKQGRFTAHWERERVPHGAWRAHRKLRNHTHNLRLGATQDLTMAVLEHAAATLQAQLN